VFHSCLVVQDIMSRIYDTNTSVVIVCVTNLMLLTFGQQQLLPRNKRHQAWRAGKTKSRALRERWNTRRKKCHLSKPSSNYADARTLIVARLSLYYLSEAVPVKSQGIFHELE